MMRSQITSAALVCAAVLLMPGCRLASSDDHRSFTMGDRVMVGPLTYTVISADWTPSLNGNQGERLPKDRFLLLKLSITNTGGENISIPLFTLEDGKRKSFPEVSENIENTPAWLGTIRNLAPAATEQGIIVFDVPKDNYKLRVSDGGDIEKEKTVLIDIPLALQ